MNFDWSEYLNIARELAGQATASFSAEAKKRSAISRAYYAAFCSARNHLRDRDNDQNIPVGGDAHGYVRKQFNYLLYDTDALHSLTEVPGFYYNAFK